MPVSVFSFSHRSESAVALKAQVTFWVRRLSTTSFSGSVSIRPAAPTAAWRKNSRRSMGSSSFASFLAAGVWPGRSVLTPDAERPAPPVDTRVSRA